MRLYHKAYLPPRSDLPDSIIRDVLLGTSAIIERAVNDVISLVEARKRLGMLCPHLRLAYPPSSGADRYQQRNRLPMIDPRLRYAQIANKHLHSSRRELTVGTPDHNVNASTATEDAVSDEAAHRLVSMLINPLPTSEMGAVFAQVSSLNASGGDNQQSPTRRRGCRHRRRGRDHHKSEIINSLFSPLANNNQCI